MLGVMWSRSGFGMVLNRDNGKCAMAKAFDAAIIEIDVSNFDLGRQAVSLHGKPVIVRGDFDMPILKILDRLIAAPMAEHKFEGLASERATQ